LLVLRCLFQLCFVCDKINKLKLNFSRFRRKHLFIIIRYEKHCTRPLNRIRFCFLVSIKTIKCYVIFGKLHNVLRRR